MTSGPRLGDRDEVGIRRGGGTEALVVAPKESGGSRAVVKEPWNFASDEKAGNSVIKVLEGKTPASRRNKLKQDESARGGVQKWARQGVGGVFEAQAGQRPY